MYKSISEVSVDNRSEERGRGEGEAREREGKRKMGKMFIRFFKGGEEGEGK